MTSKRLDEILRKIDEVVGPPDSEAPEDRQRRVEAAIRGRELRRAR
jgi:hypothetical protein